MTASACRRSTANSVRAGSARLWRTWRTLLAFPRFATRCFSGPWRGVWVFFYFATNGTFLTQRNLLLLALQTSIVSLAAISAVMLIVTRNFDLSVGSAVAFVGVILALLTVKYDVNPWIGVIAALGGGVAMGIVARVVGGSNRRLVFHRNPCGDVVLPRPFDDRHEWGDSRSVAGRSDGPGDGFPVSCAIDRPDCRLPLRLPCTTHI